MIRIILFLIIFTGAIGVTFMSNAAMTDYKKVRLRSLDKITARTMTFDAHVGTTIKFGSMYIKILSCQKPDVAERNDAATFLQIWEITARDDSKWIFSGWMFASSPALSAMDHPIYDVWVVDCLTDATAPDAQKEQTNPIPPEPGIQDVLKNASTPENAAADPKTSSDPPAEQPENVELPPLVTPEFKQ